jgi:trigger factor
LKVSTETVAVREVTLTIEPDPERVQRAMRDTARQLSRYRPVPGFRPGRAPYTMVERILGRDVILSEALKGMAESLYREAVREAGLEPYELGQLEVESQDPLILKANISLLPEVKLGNVEELYVEPEPEVSITEEQIDKEIERVRRAHAEYETVERGAERGDQVIASVKGTIEEGEAFDRSSTTIDLDDELQPPGFAEALIGLVAGETRSFSLTYPEDYEGEDLAGKNVELEVTISTVRQRTLPEVNDDLAKMAGDHDTLAELREALGEQLKTRLQDEARDRETEAAIEALVNASQVEYPRAALQREIDSIVTLQRSRLQQFGIVWENYLRMIESTEQVIRDEISPNAERRLVRRLVLTEYARAEGLTVDPNDINRIMRSIVSTHGERFAEETRAGTDRDIVRELYSDMLVAKAARRLMAKLTGREEELEVEEAVSSAAEGATEGDAAPAEVAELDAETAGEEPAAEE